MIKFIDLLKSETETSLCKLAIYM